MILPGQPVHNQEDVVFYSSPSTKESHEIFESGLLSRRGSLRLLKARLAESPRLETPMGTYVGELQERWQFPSDHLPIAMQFGSMRFASWNVLDAAYMSWVTEKNSQGLSRSLIADEHIYIGDLTVRDQHTTKLVLEMVNSPRDIIALQECSQAFIENVRSKLPPEYTIVSHYGEAVIVNLEKFEIVQAEDIKGLFSMTPERTLQKLTLRNLTTQETYHLVNAHLPGDPNHPARTEFALYLKALQKHSPQDKIVAMGDMNFNEVEMKTALLQAYQYKKSNPWKMLSPYCTNISPGSFYSKAIDHFFVYDPTGTECLRADSDPDQVMSELKAVLPLLSALHV